MLDKIKNLIIEEMTSENHAMFENEKDIVVDAVGIMLDDLSDAFNGLYGEVSGQMEDIRDECGSYYQDGQWRIKGYSNEEMYEELEQDLDRFEHFQRIISGVEKTDA